MSKTHAVTNFMTKIPEMINKAPPLGQLAIGGITGWTTGFVTMKVGKTAAAVAGGGLLISQIVHSQKCYEKTDWNNIKTKAQEVSKNFDARYNRTQFASTMKQLSRTNTYLAAGFVGGFLLGIAT